MRITDRELELHLVCEYVGGLLFVLIYVRCYIFGLEHHIVHFIGVVFVELHSLAGFYHRV